MYLLRNLLSKKTKPAAESEIKSLNRKIVASKQTFTKLKANDISVTFIGIANSVELF